AGPHRDDGGAVAIEPRLHLGLLIEVRRLVGQVREVALPRPLARVGERLVVARDVGEHADTADVLRARGGWRRRCRAATPPAWTRRAGASATTRRRRRRARRARRRRAPASRCRT